MALLIAAPILLLGLGGASGHAVPSTASFEVQVTSTPSSGSVPLTVTLTAVVSSGTPTSVAWTFGDGGQWSGAAPAALTVEHRYAGVGTFTAVATVTEATGSAAGSTSVSVVSGPLVAAISASPSSGDAPLSVTFHAVVTGGTGTYTSFHWTFGDGGVGAGPVVSYSYARSGNFVAQLTVIDSANETAVASVAVSVSAGSGSGSALSDLGPTTLATAGIVGAGLTFGTFYGVRRRRTGHAEADTEEYGTLPPGVFGPFPRAVDPSLPAPAVAAAEESSSSLASTAAESAASTPSDAGPVAPQLGTVSAPVAALPRLVRTRTPRAPGEEPRRWSRDIVAYLGALPTLGPDDIATIDWTQKGMSDRLHTGQNQVSNVLRRLVASGIVVERLEHVQGQPRRLKVYRLTLRGEALAREVRRRRPVSNPNLLRREW